jgi:hypothetical protein
MENQITSALLPYFLGVHNHRTNPLEPKDVPALEVADAS